MIKEVCREDEYHLDDILHTCLQHITPIESPLALLVELPFSGGEMLTHLLDGHSRLHGYPGTLISDMEPQSSWPSIDPAGKPSDWLKVISGHFDPVLFCRSTTASKSVPTSSPNIFLPILQEKLFLQYLAGFNAIKERDIFNAWMTACFGAWLNYRNHGTTKKFVTARISAMSISSESLLHFFDIYPDGKIIAPIRHPAAWVADMAAQEPALSEKLNSTVNFWKEHVRRIMDIRNQYADSVCVVTAEGLVERTDRVMQQVPRFLDIDFEETLLDPTFNCAHFHSPDVPSGAESAADLPVATKTESLDRDRLDLIEKETDAFYHLVETHGLVP
jgi:hypothetical protein